jgi:FMN reductase
LHSEDSALQAALERLYSTPVLVVASPTYKATFTGLLKVFLDHVPAGRLTGGLAIPVMVGGAPQHALAVEVHLRPLLVELGASCPTQGLYVLESQLPALPEVVGAWLAGQSRALSGWRST